MAFQCSKEEYLQWLDHPVTQDYLKNLGQYIADKSISLGEGSTVDFDSMERTFGRTCFEQGVIRGVSESIKHTPVFYNVEEEWEEGE